MKWPLALIVGLLCGSAQAQTSPAQMGITPTTVPEVLQVLDNTQTWVTIGTVNPVTHTFTPVGGGAGGEADILVTDPSVGMAAGGPDNSPFVQNLMNKLGPSAPPASTAGYDVTFPSIPGQNYTEYYFSQPIVLNRGANYHCSGTTWNPATYLIFAPGIDGVIQESYNLTGVGSSGTGMISGCHFFSMGYGTATGNAITPTQITNVAFQADPAGLMPVSSFHVGDGIILAAGTSIVPREAVLAAPIGTTVTAVAGTTLTLSNPLSSSLGYSSAAWPKSSAAFTETGTNNFVNLDTIQVGSSTNLPYTMTTTAFSSGTAARTVQIGVDFPTSAANLIAAITHSTGEGVVYISDGTASPNGFGPNPEVTASYASGVITFTSNYGGPNVNTFTSVYTPKGAAAGTFGGAAFTGANDSVSCPAPCTASNVTGMPFYQLPVGQAFQVQTTIGSNSITIISGPRLLNPGDVIWSDAFPFGSTVSTATGTVGAQTATMTGPADVGGAQNATLTHLPGAEGSLWVMPAALKRRAIGSAQHNSFGYWPIALQMACSSTAGVNCDLSRDEDNFNQFSLVGRWVAGNNTATSASINEQFNHNYITDIYEGATLAEVYLNPNTESGETGSAKWGFLKNCANTNTGAVFGGYMTHKIGYPPAANGCSDPVNVYPPTPGGAMGYNATPANGPAFTAPANGRGLTLNTYLGALSISSGNDNNNCVSVGAAPGGGSRSTLGFGIGGCAVNPTWDFSWDLANNRLGFFGGVSITTPSMIFLNSSSTGGYLGAANVSTGLGVSFPWGVILAGDGSNPILTSGRLFGMANVKPAANWHSYGDTEINVASSNIQGGMVGWYSTVGSSGFTGTIAGTNLTMPSVTAGTVAIGQFVTGTGVATGTKITAGSGLSWTVNMSQTVGPVTMTGNSWYPFGPISNDPANPDYTATTLRSGSSSNKDLTGRITLSGGTATYTLVGTYVSAPNCITADATTPANASSVSESTTVLTFTGTGSDVLKYQCVGRN